MNGLRSGPLGPGDISEIAAVWRACELHDDGRADITEGDVVSFGRRPSFDYARDTVGVRDGEALVAFGVQLGRRMTFVNVLPAFRGRGIGTELLRWSQDAARAIGAPETAQEVSDAERAAIELLERNGYTRRWDSWMLEIELDQEPPAAVPPDGYAIRGFAGAQDERVAYDVIQTAFGEWPEYDPCGLGTDSRTGARGLYEKVGMRVRRTFDEYAKAL